MNFHYAHKKLRLLSISALKLLQDYYLNNNLYIDIICSFNHLRPFNEMDLHQSRSGYYMTMHSGHVMKVTGRCVTAHFGNCTFW